MRAMYERNRTPEVRRLLWEVARLQALARRASQFTSCFLLYDSQLTATAFHIILAALRRGSGKGIVAGSRGCQRGRDLR